MSRELQRKRTPVNYAQPPAQECFSRNIFTCLSGFVPEGTTFKTMTMIESLLKASFIASFLLLFSCKNQPQEPVQTADKRLDFTIVPGERFGLITPAAATREAVLAAYGDSAKVDSIYLIDGMFDVGVVIFPNNPRNRVDVYWDNENDPLRPAFIRIVGDSTGTTDWKTPDGITLGTPLAEIERLNGKPFKINGLDWDYGGRVADWQGGKLAGTGLFFVFHHAGQADPKLLGETIFDSNDPLAVAGGIEVGMLDVRFFAREKLPACLEAKVAEISPKNTPFFVSKMNVNGQDHFWFSDGAMAVDGLEYVYDAECKVLCTLGGMRKPDECAKVYDAGKWTLLWEQY
jgi:hypothetical protein